MGTTARTLENQTFFWDPKFQLDSLPTTGTREYVVVPLRLLTTREVLLWETYQAPLSLRETPENNSIP